MALPLPVYTVDQIAQQLQLQWGGALEGVYQSWNDRTLDYAMPNTAPSANQFNEASAFVAMTAQQKNYAREAFELWDDLVSISLTETSSPDAQITLAYSGATNGGGTYTSGFLVAQAPGSSTFFRDISRERIWMADNAGNWPELQNGNLAYGERGLETYIHEIGHALGLSHPGSYNAGDGSSYANGAEYSQDTQQYTVMSYWSAGSDGAVVDRIGSAATTDVNADGINVSTPLLHDIAAIQAKYGPDFATRTGNTVYGFNSTADRGAFNFVLNPNPVIAIWDAGGNDRLDCSGYTQNQRIDLHAGSFSDVGALTQNVAIAWGCDIESAVGGSGNDSITGNDGDNVLNGGPGDDNLVGAGGLDLLYGADGNDTLYGGFGFVDQLYGGAGNDTYVVDDLDTVSEDFNAGIDTVRSSVRWVLGDNLENLILTGSANVNGFGNALNNLIFGNDGNNYLQGFAGADGLFGGAGNDTYELSDLWFLDEASGWSYDAVHEAPGEGVDTVVVGYFGNASYFLDDNVENVTVSGTQNLNVFGNELGNMMTGNSAHNALHGQDGADRIDGGGGADELFGDAGNDSLNGGSGIDSLFGGTGDDTYVLADLNRTQASLLSFFDSVGEAADEGIDTVLVQSLADPVRISTNGYTLPANVENGTITGSEAFNLTGNELDNVLIGDAAINTLQGQAGNDRLNGGGGYDTLIGGPGNDVYVLDDLNRPIQFSFNVFDVVSEAAGGGIDTVLVRSLPDPLRVSTNSYTLGPEVENGTITGSEVFNLSGNELDNVLTGNAAANRLSGGAGADHFAGTPAGLQQDTLTDFGLQDFIDVAGVRFDSVRYDAASGLLRLDTTANGSFATVLHLPAGLQGEFVALPGDAATQVRLMLDTDGDGVGDFRDNALLLPNPDQRDSDGDGYGNPVDADLNQDHTVDFFDLAQFGAVFFTADANADLNGDALVDFFDLSLLENLFGKAPGPSWIDGGVEQPRAIGLAALAAAAAANELVLSGVATAATGDMQPHAATPF